MGEAEYGAAALLLSVGELYGRREVGSLLSSSFVHQLGMSLHWPLLCQILMVFIRIVIEHRESWEF